MAEKEKKRSTTFVTSRGAIINVAAPSVYIAPGVTPVDVTSPEELREELDIHSAFTWEKFLREGVDAHFNARKVVPPNIQTLVKASEHWTQDNYASANLDLGKLRCPVDLGTVAVYSKRAFNYGVLSTRAKLPILPVGQFTAMGFENGARGLNGVICFLQDTTMVRAHIAPNPAMWRISADLTPILPANYQTAYHTYMVEVTRPMVVFYVDGIPVAYGLLIPGGRYINSTVAPFTPPPYAIFFAESTIAHSQTAFIESAGQLLGALDLDISPASFVAADGDSLPPRTIALYDAGTNTRFTALTIAAGSETSHPFPLYGYPGKTVYFRASQSGTLDVEVLMQTGNWRKYNIEAGAGAVTANQLYAYVITGSALLGRVAFTPSAYPCTVSEAEVVLQ